MMKKTILMMLAVVTLAGLSACQKTEVAVPSRTIVVEIRPGDWTTDNGRVWYADINVPQLSAYYYSQGLVHVHLSFTDNLYEPIPSTYDGIAYRFEYGVGFISIDYQRADADNLALERPSGSIWAKIVLSESDLY